MRASTPHNLKPFKKGHGKFSEKREQLKQYVRNSPYIDNIEHPIICAHFGLPLIKSVFQEEYRNRFYNILKDRTTTAATVSKITNIPHKYICECKAYWEKRGLLKVIGLGVCETTGSKGVQYLSTNKEEWDSTKIPGDNQINLFEL